MNTKPLLTLLADGAIHSGESLAESLGISRTAIWKQIRKLQEGDIEIVTIRGRGYQLSAPMDLLSADRILKGINAPLRNDVSLTVHDRIDSTNTDIIRRWQQGESGVLVSIADCQDQGRGRRGRAWQSPVGQNLYMSVGCTLARNFSQLEGLSLTAGVALVESLQFSGVNNPGLKWPNDLLLDGKKIAGILIELQGELDGAVRVVIGIGLNVHMTEAASVDQPWTSLALVDSDSPWQRDYLAADILNRLLQHIQRFEVDGFDPFEARWNHYDVFRGKALQATNASLSGVGCGVDAFGNYLLDTEQGQKKISAGEISLRVAT